MFLTINRFLFRCRNIESKNDLSIKVVPHTSNSDLLIELIPSKSSCEILLDLFGILNTTDPESLINLTHSKNKPATICIRKCTDRLITVFGNRSLRCFHLKIFPFKVFQPVKQFLLIHYLNYSILDDPLLLNLKSTCIL